jgi:hypothetical protein
MKILFTFIQFLIFFTASCQTGSKISTTKKQVRMEVIYEHQLNNCIIKFEREDTPLSCTWKAIAVTNTNKELILQTDSIEKDTGWLHQETVGESPVDLYNIAAASSEGNEVLIVYNRFGHVYLAKYDLTGQANLTKETKKIKNYLASGGFGAMKNYGEFKKIDNALYLYLHTGQSFSGVHSELYRVTVSPLAIVNINFGKNAQVLKTVQIKASSKIWMQQTEKNIGEWDQMTPEEKKRNKENEISKEDRANLATLKENLNKDFTIFQLGTDESLLRDEETRLSNIGFETHPLFNDSLSLGKAGIYLQDVLQNDTKNMSKSKITLLGYLKGKVYNEAVKNGLDDYMIYFFYRDQDSGDIKIIRYNHHPLIGYWHIGNYKEEKIPD